MSIASELNNLEGNIEDSYDAVNDMGGVIPAQRNMDNLDQAIRTIPQNTGITATTFHWGGSPNYSMYKDSSYTTAATYSDIATAYAAGLVYIADGEDEVTYVVVSDIPDAHTITVTGIALPGYEGGSASYTYASSTWTKTATEFQKKLTAGTNVQINGTTISATDTTYSDMVGATSLDAGSHGLVPAPAAGDQNKYLKGDGTWNTVSGGPTVHTVTMYAYDGTLDVALDDIPKVSFNPAFEENNVAVGIDDIVGWFNAGEEVIIETTDQKAKVISASTDIDSDVSTFTIAVNAMGDPWAATTVATVASSGSCGVPYVIDFVLNTVTNKKIAIPHVPGKYTILLKIVPVDYPTASWTIDFQNVQNVPWVVGIPSYDPIPSWAEPVASPSGSRAESAAAFMMMAHMSGMAIELAAIGVSNQSGVQVNTIPYVTAKSFGSSITDSNGNVLPIFSSANNTTQQYQYMPIANFYNINMRKGIWPVMGTSISGASYFELNFAFMYRRSRGTSPSYGTLYADVTGSGSLTNIRWDGTIK